MYAPMQASTKLSKIIEALKKSATCFQINFCWIFCWIFFWIFFYPEYREERARSKVTCSE